MACSGGCGGKSKTEKYARQAAARALLKQQKAAAAVVDLTAYSDEINKLQQSKRHRRF